MVSANLGVLHYVLDHIYGAFVHRTRLTTPFFSRGWGGSKLDLLERMVKQLFPEGAAAPAQNWPPNLVQPVWKTVWETKSAQLREGVFRTSCDEQLRAVLPPESYEARVAFLAPKYVPPQNMACVVHLAGTGDHTFERRLRLGGPLLKQNIATMVLESPFYGRRRPILQCGAKLLCVSDLLLLGRVTIDEARSLLHWLEVEAGFGKTGICGLSMGGVHAAMVGSLHPTPIATLPFLSPHSAVVAFCEGVLKHATAWEALREDAAHKAVMTLEQVEERLRSVLSLTDVTRFPIPKNPQAVIFVAATDDGYIPKHSVLELQRAWPGSEVRYQAMGIVATRLSRAEPPLRKEVVEYMLDVDSHMWSMRKSKANFFRLMSLLSGVISVFAWLGEVCNWASPLTTVLVHVLLLILVWYPELILPTLFLYMFLMGLWNYRLRPRHPPHMDTKLSWAEAVHPDELDEEFDTFPTSRSPDVVHMRYDRLRSVAGRVQTVVGDVATQAERVRSVLSWRDPRATGLFIVFCLAAAVVLYVTPFKVVALAAGLYYLRHPRFRSKLPSVPSNFFRRLPSRIDSML